MRDVSIDPEARTARAEAGVLWIEVVEAAAEHGLGANQVTAVELVTADGELRRVDRENDPET
jgi:hypothetical protein